jgi:hypothetical protein
LPSERVLYPDADEFFHDWTDDTDDSQRAGTGDPRDWADIRARFPNAVPIPAGGLSRTQEIYAIYPDKKIPFKPKRRGLKVDVCIGVRNRKFEPRKNYDWSPVAQALQTAGYSFAVIGARGSSGDLEGQRYHSGDYDTDAAIELIQKCKLWLGSDSGGSHLASTVGAKMILIREPHGRDYIPRMKEVNPNRIDYIEEGWQNPEAVITAALESLKRTDGTKSK